MFKRLLQDEKVISVTGTVIVHIVLLLLFFAIQVDFRPVIEEFTEVTLAGGFRAPSIEQPSEVPDVPTQEQAMNEKINEKLPEKIELPERRQLELDESEILDKVQPEFEKQLTPGNVVKKTPRANPPLPKTKSTGPTFSRREKQIEKGLFQKQLDEKLMKGTQKVQINVDRQFEIDWEGEIKREIYQKRLPQFPPDVQREATIKIEFSVLPNGLIGSAILLQKGDTKLENLTLEAFKTWRFNPLPDYVEDAAQKGVITFHFKLK